MDAESFWFGFLFGALIFGSSASIGMLLLFRKANWIGNCKNCGSDLGKQ